ncbi:hypothetical protein SAMD00023353_1300580 [Rosellinia necatrix]|uniref:Uncharacterized protein n=1 Tax=Rosellinia necatrix TaxID=77044 RepID=A0A1S8A6U7_ROSNE|nr:hypothetical protein SAMD00023353_1300580 [Rosellinia necatrix]
MGQYMEWVLKGVPYEMRVSRFVKFLRMPRHPKLMPTVDGHDDSVMDLPFFSRWTIPTLAVG